MHTQGKKIWYHNAHVQITFNFKLEEDNKQQLLPGICLPVKFSVEIKCVHISIIFNFINWELIEEPINYDTHYHFSFFFFFLNNLLCKLFLNKNQQVKIFSIHMKISSIFLIRNTQFYRISKLLIWKPAHHWKYLKFNELLLL